MGSGVARMAGRLVRDEDGQDLAEYGIAIGVVSAAVAALAVIIAAATLGFWETGQSHIDDALGG